MAGMYPLCPYKNFSITDIGKFGRRLKKWCKEAYEPGKSMIIFDQVELLIDVKTTIENQDGREVYQVVLEDISFSYICISGSMCIMYKIWENKTQSVMYNMPLKWDGIELWVAE